MAFRNWGNKSETKQKSCADRLNALGKTPNSAFPPLSSNFYPGKANSSAQYHPFSSKFYKWKSNSSICSKSPICRRGTSNVPWQLLYLRAESKNAVELFALNAVELFAHFARWASVEL